MHDIGIASQIGKYSDAVEAAPNLRWLRTSGTPGLTKDKQLPADITAQAELAWANIVEALEKAGMTVDNIVKVNQFLIRAEDIPAYVKVRTQILGDARPTSTLLVVSQLIWPEVLLEVEVIAAAT
jgi:enamine deaminase RidA (YjgF/YER057c/UK114 family)